MNEGNSGEKNPTIQLIVGLGNPGNPYAHTRHNAGAWLVEALCEKFHLKLKTENKFNAKVITWPSNGKECKILIPNTFMNHSGQSVGSVVKYYQIPVDAILVAHDDLDIPPGAVRFKTGGGHGGHNGLRDIIHHLKSAGFHRIRLGIGHPGHRDDVADYVLNPASKVDEQKIQAAIEDTLKVLPKIINGEWQTVMNLLHSRL